MTIIKTPKKLIEVALPLDDINEASAKEKSVRHGHPSTLHLWWARRPLAAARAVIFAQMVNDPGYERSLGRGVNKAQAKIERERLFGIIRKLVLWDNTNKESIVAEARAEIVKSWRETCELNRGHPNAAELFNPDKLPPFHDPFAGGGALPVEAQRLGLSSNASDLNPVAVLINKSMIEIPSKFAGIVPCGPVPETEKQTKMEQSWDGAKGLAEDVRRYGEMLRTEATKRVGHLYPKAVLPSSSGGGEGTVIAWLWARTVKSPNPAFSHVDVPLVSNFVLCSKVGKEIWVDPKVKGDTYTFEIRTGKPPESAKEGTKAAGRGANFFCLVSGTPISGDHIKAEGVAGRMSERLMALVVEGKRGRIYLPPNDEHERAAKLAAPKWRPAGLVPAKLTGGTCVPYGLKEWGNLFTDRQLVALDAFADVVSDLQIKIKADAIAAGMLDDGIGLEQGGRGASAYADAIAVYLAFAIDRMAMTGNSLVRWNGVGEKAQHCFGRQALPMLWDFAEPNFLADATGSLSAAVFYSYDPIPFLPTGSVGTVVQADAQTQSISSGCVVSTDPPYYDNIGYADLSDFFYVWLRRTLRGPPRHNTCRLHRNRNPGAAKKDNSGTIRTNIQGPSSSALVAARERGG
ncbi:DUF1156 domain-containing protein, partial [Rhodoferax sp.]|uniref:DUF1156 domain-containing protein n=1 Tax=Rhodoferax sp. TaxID=50421 RepID=UPI0027724E2E|nr:DUF1156 domain-containing protein [Rhodoferax sp.]